MIEYKNSENVYSDTEYDNLWKKNLIKHFNIKVEDIKDVNAIFIKNRNRI